MALADMRRRRGRALALLLGLVVATSGFIVLTGNTETARLEVIGTVHDSARGAYDILVRPAGARTDLETQSGLVRPNFLSGQYGGISMAQYERIRQIPVRLCGGTDRDDRLCHGLRFGSGRPHRSRGSGPDAAGASDPLALECRAWADRIRR
jgi:hypothetical protein